MKVLINRQPINGPWGGGNNFVRAFFRYAPDFGIQLGTKLNQQYDAVLIIDPRPDELGIGINEIHRYKLMKPHVKIFQRVNECDARKNTTDVDAMLHASSAINDHTFFVSNWMLDYHTKLNWQCGSTSVIYNGVDKEIFCPRKKLENGKLNIVSFHWSDNKYKGYDVHAWLDEFVGQNLDLFSYTFVGRHQNDFKNTTHIPPLSGLPLGEEISKYDISITGTVADPSPNHIFEAIACGIPTYAHVRGGGAVELVDKNHTYSSVEELKTILFSKEHIKNSLQPSDWRECIREYIETIKKNVGSL